jgi:flagellar protein FliT
MQKERRSRKDLETADVSTSNPTPTLAAPVGHALLQYYEAIEQASQDMLSAAREGNWDRVVKLEGACAVLISQLKHAAAEQRLGSEEAQLKARIMQRILLNDAEIRHLAEPWLEDLDQMLAGKPRNILH